MPQAEKVVRYIAPKVSVSEEIKNKYRQKRVAANKSTATRFRRDITQRKSTPNRNGSSSGSLLTKESRALAPSTATSLTR